MNEWTSSISCLSSRWASVRQVPCQRSVHPAVQYEVVSALCIGVSLDQCGRFLSGVAFSGRTWGGGLVHSIRSHSPHLWYPISMSSDFHQTVWVCVFHSSYFLTPPFPTPASLPYSPLSPSLSWAFVTSRTSRWMMTSAPSSSSNPSNLSSSPSVAPHLYVLCSPS